MRISVSISNLKPKVLFGCSLLLSGILLVACGPQATQKPHDRITVQLKWVHQAQFTGFYVAQEKGYYSEENLEVILLVGGLEIDFIDQVFNGDTDFGVTAPDEILLKHSQAAYQRR